MGNYDAGILGIAEVIDALGHDAESINVQTAVRFVKNGELRLKHGHLENLIAFFSPPENPSLTERLASLLSSSTNSLRSRISFQKIGSRHRVQSLVFPFLVDCSPHEVDHADSRNLHRILETEEDTLAGTVLRWHLQQILAIEDDLARSDRIGRATRQNSREGALAGAIRTHHSMHLTRVDGEVDPFQYFLIANVGM